MCGQVLSSSDRAGSSGLASPPALPSVGSVRPLLCANQSLFPSFSHGLSSWSMSSRAEQDRRGLQLAQPDVERHVREFEKHYSLPRACLCAAPSVEATLPPRPCTETLVCCMPGASAARLCRQTGTLPYPQTSSARQLPCLRPNTVTLPSPTLGRLCRAAGRGKRRAHGRASTARWRRRAAQCLPWARPAPPTPATRLAAASAPAGASGAGRQPGLRAAQARGRAHLRWALGAHLRVLPHLY